MTTRSGRCAMSSSRPGPRSPEGDAKGLGRWQRWLLDEVERCYRHGGAPACALGPMIARYKPSGQNRHSAGMYLSARRMVDRGLLAEIRVGRRGRQQIAFIPAWAAQPALRSSALAGALTST